MKQYLELCWEVNKYGEEKKDRTGTGTISLFGTQTRYDVSEGFPLLTTKKVHLKSIIHELLWFIKGDTNIRYLVQNGVNIWNDWPYKSYVDMYNKLKKESLELKNLEKEYRDSLYDPSYGIQGPSSDLKNYGFILRKPVLTMKEFVNKVKEDDRFAEYFGELGPVYGEQWRNFSGLDQLSNAIEQIKNNPTSRRILVSSWNPPLLHSMALPPCHMLFQFYVNNGKLSLQLYQRSADIFLGVPFNIASYSLLLMMVAQVTGLEVGDFIHTIGDAHIYSNHIEQIELQLSREPRELPKMILNKDVKSIYDFKYDDFTLKDYNPHPRIKGKVAV